MLKHFHFFIFQVLIFFPITFFSAKAQTCQTKEITVNYSNGYLVFEVCISNPAINYSSKSDYRWYSEKGDKEVIKTTQGGSGGPLLNGKEKFFDEKGNLTYEKNYVLGLLNGETKHWNNKGGLEKIYKYLKGEVVATKEKVEDGWFESTGTFWTNGYSRRYLDYGNNVITESVYKDGDYITKDYYKFSNILRYQYSTPSWCDTCYTGRYTAYYKNGKKEFEGLYSDTLSNIKVGVWKWYSESGALKEQESYKEEFLKWPNGEWKITGGYYLDLYLKKWLKIGAWNSYDEKGKRLTSIYYHEGFDDEQ